MLPVQGPKEAQASVLLQLLVVLCILLAVVFCFISCCKFPAFVLAVLVVRLTYGDGVIMEILVRNLPTLNRAT
jgi:hypothetical protein